VMSVELLGASIDPDSRSGEFLQERKHPQSKG
jgi:hypothetical protein